MRTSLGQMYRIGIIAFILFLSTLVGVPVLPALSRELGADTTQIPIVVSAALATVVVAQLFTGILADRYSKRRLILIGALIGSLSSLLCVIASHWTQLLTLRIIGGIADAISMPALLAITASLGTERPGKFFGILQSSQGLSFVVGPAIGSAFSLVSLRTPFLVDGLLSFVAFLAVIRLFKDKSKVTSEHNLRLFQGIRSTFSNKRIYLYLLMGVSGLFGFGILYSFVPTKSQLIGLDAWQIGIILAGGALIYSLISYVVGKLSDRYGRRMFVISSQVIIMAAITGLIFSDSYTMIFMCYGLFCVGEATTFLLCFVYATDILQHEYIGTSMGAFDSILDLSLFVSPLIGISVYSSTKQIVPIFIIAMAPAILALFTTAIWLPHKKNK